MVTMVDWQSVLPCLASRTEQNTVDPEVRQQIEAVTKRREEAYNKYDAAAYAAFYTQDAVDFWSEEGAAFGLPAIEKRYEVQFASYPAGNHSRLFRYIPSAMEYVRSWNTFISRGRAMR
jgi:hypothetical protein